MKKVVCFLLVVVMMFSVVGCGDSFAEDSNVLDINEFIETYKREDIAVLSENPQKFIDDLYATVGSLDAADFSKWAVSDYSSEIAPWYEIDTVLFNLPASVDAIYNSAELGFGGDTIVSFSTDNCEEDIDLFNSLCEYALKKYGDASTVMYDHEEITEHEWRENYYLDGNCSLFWERTVGKYTESLYINHYGSNYDFLDNFSRVSVSTAKYQNDETK